MRTRFLFLVPVICFAFVRVRGSDAIIALKLYVANTSGDNLSVIDLANQVVDHEIKIGTLPHGLAVSPDQRKLYCSVESERALKILDTRSDKIVGTIQTTGVPN